MLKSKWISKYYLYYIYLITGVYTYCTWEYQNNLLLVNLSETSVEENSAKNLMRNILFVKTELKYYDHKYLILIFYILTHFAIWSMRTPTRVGIISKYLYPRYNHLVTFFSSSQSVRWYFRLPVNLVEFRLSKLLKKSHMSFLTDN